MPSDGFRNDLRKARSGDREALNRLLDRNQDRLLRLARTRIGTSLKARVRTSDVLQSTYLDVLKGVGEFDGDSEEAFVAWVGRILENNIRDKGKYFGAKKRRHVAAVGDPEDPGRGVLARTPTPSATAACSEDLLLVSRALESLPEDYRRVIMLRQVEGRSHKEAAAILERTEAATRMLLSRARAALALELDRLRGSADGG